MTNKELIETAGGAAINATMLNAIARCVTSLYELGRACGTGIRMIFGKKYC